MKFIPAIILVFSFSGFSFAGAGQVLSDGYGGQGNLTIDQEYEINQAIRNERVERKNFERAERYRDSAPSYDSYDTDSEFDYDW